MTHIFRISKPFTIRLMTACMLVSGLVLGAGANTAWAFDDAGMVLSLNGHATAREGDQIRILEELDSLVKGEELQVEKGATMKVSVYSADKVYQLTGPATAKITDKGLVHVRGNSAVEVKVQEESSPNTANTGNSQFERPNAGAVIMRSIKPAQEPKFANP